MSAVRLYLRALAYFRADLHLIGIWLLLIGLSTVIGLLSAWPMAILLDTVLSQQRHADLIHRLFESLLPFSPVGQIATLASIGLGMKLGQDLLAAAQILVSNQINYNGLMRLRCDLYRKLQALNIAYHKAQPQGDAIYRLSSDTFGCQTILGILISTVVAVLTLAVMIIVLASRSPALTCLAISILPPLAVTNVVFGRRLKNHSLRCKEQDSRFITAVQRTLSCIGLVQAFGREAQEFDAFHGTVQDNIRAWWGLNRQQITYNILIGMIFGIGGAIVFGYGGYLVHRGTLTPGDLVIFTAYLGVLWAPLCTLTGFSANMQGGVAGAERVLEVLDRDPVITDHPGAVSLPCRPRLLEFDCVSFAYESSLDKPVLNELQVKIEPGRMVAFVGSSGVGKSTLLNLLPRFYDPTGGAVRWDGIDARDIRLADLRRQVALVLQESVILPATVAENIAYGRPAASRAEIQEAARLAGAHQFIQTLPQGYNTPITEGGQNLSGGQRQRIAIARALITGAPVLVLDEPTSALDPLHERMITQTLVELRRHRTIVLVSHRLAAARCCDQIYVLDQGRVVEQGTHESLLERGGLYRTLCNLQFNESLAFERATAA